MKKQYIYSFILGGVFFSVPYLALGIGAVESAIIGVVAYGAGNLIFKKRTKIDITDDINQVDKKDLKEAENMVIRLREISKKLEDAQIIKNTNNICDISTRIIETVVEKPEKINKIRNFLNYYLPVTVKILERYDEIENQKLTTDESEKFMNSVEKMVQKINKAFEEQLSNIYQREMVDTDAELKVFEAMLKTDGFIENIDFNIKD